MSNHPVALIPSLQCASCMEPMLFCRQPLTKDMTQALADCSKCGVVVTVPITILQCEIVRTDPIGSSHFRPDA